MKRLLIEALSTITNKKVLLKESRETLKTNLISLNSNLQVVLSNIDSVLLSTDQENAIDLEREIKSFQIEAIQISDKINDVIGGL